MKVIMCNNNVLINNVILIIMKVMWNMIIIMKWK